MLLALLIRGCTLEGSILGIEYFLGLNGKGDWSKLRMVFILLPTLNCQLHRHIIAKSRKTVFENLYK